MKRLILIAILFSSCVTSKWTVQPGTLEFKGGECKFTPSGDIRPLKDTIIFNSYRLRRI